MAKGALGVYYGGENRGLAQVIQRGQDPYLSSMLRIAQQEKADKEKAQEKAELKKEKDEEKLWSSIENVGDLYYAHEGYKVKKLNEIVDLYSNGDVDLIGARKQLLELSAQASKSRALGSQLSEAVNLAEKDKRIDQSAYEGYLRKTLVTDDWTNEGYEFDANGFYANQAAAEKIIKESETVKAVLDNLGESVMTTVSNKDLGGLPSTMVGKITMTEVVNAKDAFEVVVDKNGVASFRLKDESKLPPLFYDNIIADDAMRVVIVKNLNKRNPNRTTPYTRDEMIEEAQNLMLMYSGKKTYTQDVETDIKNKPQYRTTTTTTTTDKDKDKVAFTNFYDNLVSGDMDLAQDASDYMLPNKVGSEVKLNMAILNSISSDNELNRLLDINNIKNKDREIGNNLRLIGTDVTDGNVSLVIRYEGESKGGSWRRKGWLPKDSDFLIPIPKNVSRAAIANLYALIRDRKQLDYGGIGEVGAERQQVSPTNLNQGEANQGGQTPDRGTLNLLKD